MEFATHGRDSVQSLMKGNNTPPIRYVAVSGTAIRVKFHGIMITSALVKARVRAASLLCFTYEICSTVSFVYIAWQCKRLFSHANKVHSN